MFVKQISMTEALRQASKGREILVMASYGSDENWEGYTPETLQNMLKGCLFFRREPALEEQDGLEAGRMVSPGIQEGRAVTLEEQLRGLPEAPKNRPPDVWIPARLAEKEAGTAAR